MFTAVNPSTYNFLMKHRCCLNILDCLPDTDLILIAEGDGYEFAVHKFIMFSGSKYFKPYQYDLDKIIIPNMPSEILDLIITSIYGGKVGFPNFVYAQLMLNLASKWGLKLLIESADAYVFKHLTYKRSMDIFAEAYKHERHLLQCATRFLLNYACRKKLTAKKKNANQPGKL